MTIQEVIEKKGRLLKELEVALQVEEKDFDEGKVQKIEADLDIVEKQKRAIEIAQERLARVEPEKKLEKRTDVPFRDAMDLFIRGKEYVDGEVRDLPPKKDDFDLFEKRAYDWNKTDATGGYLAPDMIASEIADAQAYVGGMVTPGLCKWMSTSTGNKIEIPTVNDTAQKGAVVSGSTAMTSGNAVTYATSDLTFYKITSHIATIANELVQDAAFDVVAHVTDILFKRLYRGLNYYFTMGTGTAMPTGIHFAANKAVDAAKRSITSDNLLELIYDVNRAYRDKAAFQMNDSTLGTIRRLYVSSGTTVEDLRPLWQDSLQAGEPARLHGYPVIVNNEMDEINAYNKTVFFGDWQRYWIGEAVPMKLVRMDEYYKPSDQVGLCFLGRWAGNLAAYSTDYPIRFVRHAST